MHRWIKSDPNFGAAYNAWQQELIDSGRARVLAMSEAALNTVNAAIEKGDAYVALQVARATGVLTPARPGATDTEELKRRQALRAGRPAKKLAAAERELDPEASRRQAWMEDVAALEAHIDGILIWRIKALAAETPEARERRLTQRGFYSGHARTTRLLELVDAHAPGEFEFADRRRTPECPPTPPLITAAPSGSETSEAQSEDRGGDAAARQSPAPGPEVPGPEVPGHGGAGAGANPAPGITKSVATRVQGGAARVGAARVGAARARSARPYDPHADLPTEGGPWHDL